VITSKLTSKSQTTIPQPVRKALGLAPGDELSYEIEGGRVVLARVEKDATIADPFESFAEWQGPEDEEAYAQL
jgi:antitoxin PrlF